MSWLRPWRRIAADEMGADTPVDGVDGPAPKSLPANLAMALAWGVSLQEMGYSPDELAPRKDAGDSEVQK